MTEDNDKNREESPCGCGDRGNGGGRKWVWIILAVCIVAVFFTKSACKCGLQTGSNQTAVTPPAIVPAPSVNKTQVETDTREKALPHLVDLGAGKCIPCKMMAPILEDLKKTYAGRMDVVFIDVWQNPDAGKKYGINVIPTQIFYDTAGKEVFRHEGFFGKDDILAKWKELGVDLTALME